jgi:hypothetical protein
MSALSGYAQTDSLKVFFIGQVPGEKFQVYWKGKKVLDVSGSTSYKESFSIPKEERWRSSGGVDDLTVYRRGKFGVRYKDTGFFSGFENKKYLIIKRNPRLKNRAAVEAFWSDVEPKKPPMLHPR